MATQVQHRRGTAAAHETFTGALGEITVVTDSPGELRIHDGVTVGGHPVLGTGTGDFVTGINVLHLHRLTQAQYDAIPDPDGDTIYFIVPESDVVYVLVGSGTWADVGTAIV